MSTDPVALLTRAAEALEAVIQSIRGAALKDDPAILHRIGRLDTLLTAAQATAAAGRTDSATLLASDLLREIARDFPANAAAPLDLLTEDRLRRRLARDVLEIAA